MSSSLQPLVLYYYGPSPNPMKVLMIIEELSLPYKLEEVDDKQLKVEPFISLNPNGRAPAMIDPNRDITLFEVSKCNIYAQSTSQLTPTVKRHHRLPH
jgi:glutathione S-transferase